MSNRIVKLTVQVLFWSLMALIGIWAGMYAAYRVILYALSKAEAKTITASTSVIYRGLPVSDAISKVYEDGSIDWQPAMKFTNQGKLIF